jgi:arginase
VGYAIVEVPAMAGDATHAAAEGPAALSAALAKAGHRLPAQRVAVHELGAESLAASLEINRRLAQRVEQIIARGERPLVLAGSCDVAPGVLAGLREPEAGVVWIDAHADFNTPDSSASGFWPGMTLAVVVGDCCAEVWSALAWRPVNHRRVVLLGTRSLSPAAEVRRLAQSQVRVVAWKNGVPAEEPSIALEHLAGEVRRVYVHLDLDALDPSIGAGVVDPPVPGGLSKAQILRLIDELRERFTVVGATIATYTPANDDGTTLPVAVAAVGALVGARADNS